MVSYLSVNPLQFISFIFISLQLLCLNLTMFVVEFHLCFLEDDTESTANIEMLPSKTWIHFQSNYSVYIL